MNVEDILETVKKSIHNHCIKQMMNPLKKEFILILDNDEDEKITFIGIDFVLSWIQKIFDYKVSTYSIDVIDPDDKEPIVSLFQGTGYEWQITYNSQWDDEGFSD